MDLDAIIIAAIAAIPPTLVAAAAFYQAWKAHSLVNSRMTELLEITKRSATDAATLAEKGAQKQREDGRKRL